MISKSFLSLLRIVSILTTPIIVAQSHSHDAKTNHDPKLEPYIEQVSELSSRARANVYFANPQSIFKGVQVNFVNVGAGNLTFLRRDMVASGRMPLVLARVYDSSSEGSGDFGPGWTLSVAETITVAGDSAHIMAENGSTIDFVKNNETRYQLQRAYPSDYDSLSLIDATTIEAKLRSGLTKQFVLNGGVFRLAKVTDRNGNDLRLSYNGGLLSKIENATHFIALTRNAHGRVILAQDDQNRKVQYLYDEKGALIEADDLGGKAWTYSYTGGKLQAARDPLRRLNFGAAFDDNGRVRRLQLPSGVIGFSYDASTRSATVTDRKDLVSRFFQDEDGVTTRVVNALGEETAIGLDENRNVISLSRNGSVVEKMEYDRQGRLAVRHSNSGAGTVDRYYGYDPETGLLLSIHAASGEGQSFTYDANGNLATAALPDGLRKYLFSTTGDLSSCARGSETFTFSVDLDGLTASMTEGKGDVTKMRYKSGAELSNVTFSDGSNVKYEYQPSGLRANLAYSDKRRIEYEYDPAGNLTSTKIFDRKGRQISGQILGLDDSYQLIKQSTFDGKTTNFRYDKNGNLIEIRQEKSLTRFEYDSLNRLTAVVTPEGERLSYSYRPGERSLVEEYEHSRALIADHRDTGLSFGSALEVLVSRPVIGVIGPIRFSESLGTYQLANADGTEVVTPEQGIEQPLQRLQLATDGTQLTTRQNVFNRPFNPIFIPAEYATINCCPMCIVNPARCFECDPDPPDPTSITSMDPDQEDMGSTSFQVTFTGTFSGSTPSITFDKTGISATVQSHTNFSIAATFTIGNGATVGVYTVTVHDTGGSDTATLTLSPFIDSIEPPSALVGTSVPVTIAGKGFGTAPTITLGGGITASNISASDTQITATFNLPSTAGGDQTLTVTNQGFSTQGDTFFVQVPTTLSVLSVVVLPDGPAPPAGCSGSQPYGIMIDITYQVLDQRVTPIMSTNMVPHESGIFFTGGTFNGNIGPVPGYPTSSGTTALDGTFHDVPLGICSPLPISNPGLTATQNISMILPNGSSYPIRSQTFTAKAPGAVSFGHGTISNSVGDINATR